MKIALTLMHDGSAISGTWRLWTGGFGTFARTLAPAGCTLAFSMRGCDRQCVTIAGGIAAYAGDRISGSYRGAHCPGAVGNGRLDIRKR